MILASIDTIPGKNFEVLGIVKGTVVQSKHIGRDFLAGLKTIVGGEIKVTPICLSKHATLQPNA